MDFIDYREKLGIGFCDKDKFKYFKTKIFNVLNIISQDDYSQCMDTNEYYTFCNITGMPYNTNYDSDYDRDYQNLNRFKDCLSMIERTNSLNEFLSYYVALVNSIKTDKNLAKAWKRANFSNLLCNMLDESHIPFDLLEDKGEYFVFHKGAKELDKALVSEPLEWLKEYPCAHKTYCIALRQYSEGIYIRDVADNLRKVLEAFLQEFLKNNKNLESNKNEICRYLGEQGVDSGISGLFQTLINAYKNINDRIAKHNDAVDEKLLEFLLYQTGVLIRMVISIKMKGEENQ